MDPSQSMLPAQVQTLCVPSSCSSPSTHSPPSPSSRSFDASSFCSTSRLIETLYPSFSRTMDCATPSSSSQPMVFRATGASSSTKLEPKFQFPSCKSLPHASVVVDIPRPLESLQSSPIPPFLSKTYDIVNDPSLDRFVCWSPAGQSFVVWDPVEFSRVVLPRHFKHGNFSSFVRQLNTYGFRKIDGDRWEFANEDFLRGKRLLLKNINRRRLPRTKPKDLYLCSSMEMELLGAEDELQKLRSENNLLMQEVVKMKQEHLVTVKQMDKMDCRLQSAELRQKQMLSFSIKVLRNPVFLMQLKQKSNLKEIASSKRSVEQSQVSYVNNSTMQQIVKYGQNLCDPGSTFVFQGLESSSEIQLADQLLQDMSGKLDLDVNVLDGSSNKPLEIVEPSFNQNASFKGKNIMISKDASLGSADLHISSPEEFSSKLMVMEPTSPLNDVSREAMLFNSVKSGGEIACEEELWDVDFEAGGCLISAHDMLDNFVCTNPVVPGDEIGLSEIRDFGLQLDEDFDFDKCFGSQFPLLLHMDEDGSREDHPKTSEP